MIRIITYIYHITRDFRNGIRNETDCSFLVPSRSRDEINFEIPVPNPDGTKNPVGTARPCEQPDINNTFMQKRYLYHAR